METITSALKDRPRARTRKLLIYPSYETAVDKYRRNNEYISGILSSGTVQVLIFFADRAVNILLQRAIQAVVMQGIFNPF